MTGEEKDANGKVAKVTLPDGQVIELPLLHDASGARFLVGFRSAARDPCAPGIRPVSEQADNCTAARAASPI